MMNNLHPLRTRNYYRENDFAWLWTQNGIVYNVIKPGVRLELIVAKHLVKDRVKLVGNSAIMPLYLDIRELTGMDEDGSNYFVIEGMKKVSAAAYYIDDAISSFLSHMMINLYSPVIPAKSFTGADLAIEWLEYFKNIHQ